jgi:hypothetical protein
MIWRSNSSYSVFPSSSGFHTPVEKETLTVLLRGQQPIVYCPVRSIDRWRVPKELRPAIDQGRMLLLSPSSAEQARITADLADLRNQLVVNLATNVLVVYAAPGNRTFNLCIEALASCKRVVTPRSSHTDPLAASGVEQFEMENLGL